MSFGVDAYYFVSDISSDESLDELFAFAKSKGSLGAVVNSAGVSGVGDDPAKTFIIDLLGTKNIVEAALKVAEKDMVVVLISSMMGYVIPANPDLEALMMNPEKEESMKALVEMCKGDSNVAYNMSKRGVQVMAEKYATAFGKKGARIVSVSPGIIMTPMAKLAAKEHPEQLAYMESLSAAGRNGEPGDIAAVVEFLASDKASFITGADLRVDGGLIKNFPMV